MLKSKYLGLQKKPTKGMLFSSGCTMYWMRRECFKIVKRYYIQHCLHHEHMTHGMWCPIHQMGIMCAEMAENIDIFISMDSAAIFISYHQNIHKQSDIHNNLNDSANCLWWVTKSQFQNKVIRSPLRTCMWHLFIPCVQIELDTCRCMRIRTKLKRKQESEAHQNFKRL